MALPVPSRPLSRVWSVIVVIREVKSVVFCQIVSGGVGKRVLITPGVKEDLSLG